jgi:hypothetical protein
LVAAKDSIQSVEAFVLFPASRPEAVKMERTGSYNYKATIPADKIRPGILKYFIVVNGASSETFPSGLQTHPQDWDFYDNAPYKVSVISSHEPLYIFNAATDEKHLSRQWLRNSFVVPEAISGKAELQVNIDKLFKEDPENKNATPVHDYSIRYYAGEKIQGRREDLKSKSRIVIGARSLNNTPGKLQVALIDNNGIAYGSVIDLEPDKKEISIDLASLKKVKIVTLPRPYPTFLPYYFEDTRADKFDIRKLESIQLSVGPELTEEQLRTSTAIGIESIRLE